MSEPQFKAVLANYRALIEAGPDDDHRTSILKILDRWRDHTSRDELWESLGELLPLRPPAGFFIASVINSRRITDEVRRVSRGFPELKETAERHIESEWSSPDGDFVVAGVKKAALTELNHEIEHLLGRQRKNAAKRRFIEHWSDHFRDHCGKPADKLVGIITDIAFGGEHTIDDVRDALKFRKRRDRDTRRQK